ncbi:hypothetical protein Taro_010303 [Colocasia esculenta]|uniref:Glycosyltransferase 61 catalytic domain-containing protein n=1 Tax=Colocasia esculenta TaxID=4460 RepID=A0A843U2N5_COLES|nr:hypothetical protein [Colocasia esculenta]
MGQHHRPYGHFQPRKGDEEQQQQQNGPQQVQRACCEVSCGGVKKARPRLLRLVLVFCLVSCSFLFGPRLLFGADSNPLPFFLYSFGSAEDNAGLPIGGIADGGLNSRVPCSSVPDNSICCDRTSSIRTDVCVLRGDVRTRSSASSIFLYSAASSSAEPVPAGSSRKLSNHSFPAPLVEKIRPYTRKWETSIMDTVEELNLVVRRDTAGGDTHKCDVVHGVPAVVFSTGGYTGNVYHEFNDGIIPLYITSRRYNRRVVFVMLEYHSWWVTKYGDILSRLSAYPPVDFSSDKRTHCFPEATVGLRIHDELAVDATLMPGNGTILDFRQLLDDAYRPRIRDLEQEEAQEGEKAKPEAKEEVPQVPSVGTDAPKLVIISRNGSRGIENEKELVELCEEIGFQVDVVRPDRTSELAKIYRALNASDAMIGVHGAAMTHLLFMRPGSVFIQVVPLGTDWAAQTYYGDPAVKMGLKYVAYKILPRESSLYAQYAKDDPVLTDPKSVTSQGWQMTKKIYLDGQTVKLDLNRFLKRLTRAYQHIVARKMGDASLSWNENWLPRQQRERREQQRRSARR